MVKNFGANTRPNVDDLKDKASYLKNKYKNVEEADFRDITSTDEESDPSTKDNV